MASMSEEPYSVEVKMFRSHQTTALFAEPHGLAHSKVAKASGGGA
jgi:hypothetical protein